MMGASPYTKVLSPKPAAHANCSAWMPLLCIGMANLRCRGVQPLWSDWIRPGGGDHALDRSLLSSNRMSTCAATVGSPSTGLGSSVTVKRQRGLSSQSGSSDPRVVSTTECAFSSAPSSNDSRGHVLSQV